MRDLQPKQWIPTMSNTEEIRIVAELHYKNPVAALDWLSQVFGLKTRIIVHDAEGNFVFSETGWGENTVAVLPEQPELNRSPEAVDGVNTQTVRVRSNIDVVSHCEKARAAGARIIREPEQFFFGDLTYFVADIEGHIWVFAQPIPGKAGPPPEGWKVTFPPR